MKRFFKSLIAVSCVAVSVFTLSACGSEGTKIIPSASRLGTAKQATTLSYEERKNYRFSYINESAEAFAADFASLAYADYDKGENFAVSPMSVYMALSLAAQCSAGETRSEILSVLGVTYDQLSDGFSDYYRSVFNEYYEWGETGKDVLAGMIDLTNSIWIDKDASVKQDCIDVLSEKFFCDSFATAFKEDNAAANSAVQNYVKDKTRGLIDKNFQLSEETVFTLINTLYLKDIWNDFGDDLQFTDNNFAFTQKDGKIKNVKLLQGYYNYGRVYEGESFTSFYTKTENGNRIDFILPSDNYTVKDVFTADNINEVKSISDYNGVDHDRKEIYNTRCLFPEFTASYDGFIKSIIQKLGITKFFIDGECDFSTLTDESVYCENIVHATELKVDRKGIEGAAVTVEMMSGSSGPGEYTTVYEDFIIDKAFGFIISDMYGNTLFSGVAEKL